MRTGGRVDCFMCYLMSTFIAACSFCRSVSRWEVGTGLEFQARPLESSTVMRCFLLLFQKSLCFIIQAGAQCWCVAITLGLTAFCRYVCHSLNDVHFYESTSS